MSKILENLEQEAFCRWYTTKGDTFNSAVYSYAAAYGYELPVREEDGKVDVKSSEYTVCQVSGSRLIRQEKIVDRVKDIWLEKFNNTDYADARIQEIIEGGKDTDSIQAIKVLNDLKQRVTKKLDITTNGRPFAAMSDEELEKLASE